MPEHREGYYDYMLRRTKEENAKGDLIKNKTQEIQKENYIDHMLDLAAYENGYD